MSSASLSTSSTSSTSSPTAAAAAAAAAASALSSSSSNAAVSSLNTNTHPTNSATHAIVSPTHALPTMEVQLNQTVNQILQQENVSGVVVSDHNGLCMTSRGILSSLSSAYAHSLFDTAVRLSEDGEHPVVSIQTGSNRYLIRHSDGYTTAVVRSVTPAPLQKEAAAVHQAAATQAE